VHKYLLGLLLAFAFAAPVVVVSASPAEAIVCPARWKECKKYGRTTCCRDHGVHRPRPKPVSVPTPPAKPRCLQAVRDPGPGGSVKIKCIRWGSLPAVTASCRRA
jgi:hypothetical protein